MADAIESGAFVPLSADSRNMSGFRISVHDHMRSPLVSLVQKAVRRGQFVPVYFSIMELIQSQCITRLINRLITIVSEDIGPAGGWLALQVLNTLNFCFYPTYNAKKKSASGEPMWRFLRDDPSFCAAILGIGRALTLADKSRFGDDASMAWFKWREAKDGVSPAFPPELDTQELRVSFAFQKWNALRVGSWTPTSPSDILSYFALLCEVGLETTASLCTKLENGIDTPSFRPINRLISAVCKLRHLRSGGDSMKGNCTISHLAHLLCFPTFPGPPPSSFSNRVDPLSADSVAHWMRYIKSHAKTGPTPFQFPAYVYDMHTGNFELSKADWIIRENQALSPRSDDQVFLDWENRALVQANARCDKWEKNGWLEKKKKGGGKKRSSEEKKPPKKKNKAAEEAK